MSVGGGRAQRISFVNVCMIKAATADNIRDIRPQPHLMSLFNLANNVCVVAMISIIQREFQTCRFEDVAVKGRRVISVKQPLPSRS